MHCRMIRYSDGRDLGFKKCPRILLDGGRLGPKWSAFIAKVVPASVLLLGSVVFSSEKGPSPVFYS
jgi:hypothetical protein